MHDGGHRYAVTPRVVIFAAAAFTAVVYSAGFWRQLSNTGTMVGAKAWLLGAALGVLIAAIHALLYFVFAFPRLLKPALVGAAAIGGPLSYLSMVYATSIDHHMLATALQTNRAEARDLFLHASFFAWFGATAVLPAIVVWKLPITWPALPAQFRNNVVSSLWLVALVTVITGASYGQLASLFREHRQLRYMIAPANGLFAAGDFAVRMRAAGIAREPLTRIAAATRGAAIAQGATAQSATAQGATPSLTLIVIGETARGDHFSINGYGRPTTPRLATVPDLVSFPDATSCATLTAASLPCMFSGLGRAGAFKDMALTRESLPDVLAGAGFDVVWIDNQAGCKGVCTRIETIYTEAYNDPRYCSSGECHDEILVEQVRTRLSKLKRDTVVFLHMMGSHGPAYWKRYPLAFEVFKPACKSAAFANCTRDEIAAAYDNTIRYTDHVLVELIDTLRVADTAGHATAMLYVSDHGESLGERGVYLHGVPFHFAPRAQTHVPFLFWMSPRHRSRYAIPTGCLEAARNKPVSHDHFFHSVLGLLDVQTRAKVEELDLVRRCPA